MIAPLLSEAQLPLSIKFARLTVLSVVSLQTKELQGSLAAVLSLRAFEVIQRLYLVQLPQCVEAR